MSTAGLTFPEGVIAATLTPMHRDLSADIDMLVGHVRFLLENGCNGIALLGTTGEANSFSSTERKAILEGILLGGISPDKIVVGTGCCSFPETVELTNHAMSHGVGGVLMLPPFYYKQIDDDGLFEYFKLVLQKVDRVGLHIYLYNFPKLSGIAYTPALIGRLIDRYPAQIAGIKDSSGDFSNMSALARSFPEFRVYTGTEKFLLDLLNEGGAGTISATVNIYSNLAAEVYSKWQEGSKEASELQKKLTTRRTALDGIPFVPLLKAIIARRSGNDQWLHLRPPHHLFEPHVIGEFS
jgi:4-hydroxy-tetrahydrodipicolinate synthase